MSSIHFERITEETLYIALEIINSNHVYNELENGKPNRTTDEIKQELMNDKTISIFIKLDDTYIGVIDYLLINEKDQMTWIGLLMIHVDYQGYGFGKQAYLLLEQSFIEEGLKSLRVGVLKENKSGRQFWEALGFKFVKTSISEKSIEVDCYDKNLI